MIKLFKKIIKKTLFIFSVLHDFRIYHCFNVQKRVLLDSDYVLMEKCCMSLEDIDGLVYRITDGTALGLYREGGFIKHDDDVDVDILFNDSKHIKLIKYKFKELGFKIGREVHYRGLIQQLAFYLNNGFIFDIIFWHKNDNLIYNYSEKNYERIQDYKYFDTEKMIYFTLNNKKYPIPTPIEEWLEFRYGKDWRTPKIYKGDWKEECFDMKIMN